MKLLLGKDQVAIPKKADI